MSLNFGQKLKKFLTAFLICGAFLFVVSPNNALAYRALSNYQKSPNGTLTANEWNSLMFDTVNDPELLFPGRGDFVNTWATTTMIGPLGIGTNNPLSTLDIPTGSFYAYNAAVGSLGIPAQNSVVMADAEGNLSATSSSSFFTGNNILSLWSGTKNGNIWNGDTGTGKVGIGTTNPSALLHVNGSSIFNGVADFRGSVAIDTNSDNNSSGFEYGNGYDPLVANYNNERFRINSFFESPFMSMGVSINYLLQTEVFDSASWVKTNIGAVTANTVMNPTGILSAENIPAGTIGTANISQVVTNNTTGYWSAGIWARAQSGTSTISLRIDSSAETGTVKVVNLDTTWRFFSIMQNFSLANTTKTFRIISGTNAISLWGARMNPGESVNAYNARTTSALTAATPGIFFNNNVVYAGTFSGSLSGNANTANYSNYGSYAGFSPSDAVNKTNLWVYIGEIYLAYNSTYRFGQSWNAEINIKETTNQANKTNDQLENAHILMKGVMPTVADATAFNTTVPSFSVALDGNDMELTPSDVVMQVYSTNTTNKYIRLYVRLKRSNTHYTILPINRYGASYSSTGAISTGYCYFNTVAMVAAALPAPVQGSAVYATQGALSNLWKLSGNDIFNQNSGNVGIGTTNPLSTLDIPNSADDLYAYNAAIGSLGIPAQNSVVMSDPEGNLSATSSTSFFVSNNILSLWSGNKNGNIWNGDAGVGNVGIGTTTPGAKLDVAGNLRVLNSLPSITIGRATIEGTLGVARLVGDWQTGSQPGDVILRVESSSNKIMVGSGTATGLVVANGNVGIGTTTPTVKLTVGAGGGAALDGNELFQFANNGTVSYGTIRSTATTLYLGTVDTTGGFIGTQNSTNFALRTSGTNKLTVTSTGNVGIGTTTPAALLNVSNNSTSGGQLMITSLAGNSAATGIIFRTPYLGSNYDGSITSTYYNNLGMIFTTPRDYLGRGFAFNSNSGTTRMFIDASNGNVGIGTTNPLSTLDIPNSADDLYAYNAAVGSLGIPSQNSVVMADPEGNLSATSSTSFFVSNNILSLWSGTKNGNIWNGDAGVGNVGIGTTNPGSQFVINQLSTTSAFSLISGSNTAGFYINSSGTFVTNSGGTQNLLFTAGGNVYFRAQANGAIILADTTNATVGIGAVLSNTSVNIASKALSGSPTNGYGLQVNTPSGATNNYAATFIGGNVGIGTTAPVGKLDVNGTGGFVVSGTNLDPSGGYNLVPLQSSGKLLTGWNYSAGRGEIDLVSNRAGGDIGGFRFYDYTNAGVMNNLMTIQGAGNVGIGTTNPLSTLDIPNSASDLYAYNAAIGSLGIPSQNSVVMADPEGNLSATSSTSFFSGNNILSLWGGTKNGNIWNGDAGVGNVGIGTTSPAYRLDTYSTSADSARFYSSNSTSRIIIDGNANVGFRLASQGVNKWSNAFYQANGTGNFDYSIFNDQLNSASLIIDGDNGNVGIGTTTPAAKLHVYGNGTYSALFMNGSVGIGTTTPVGKLDVNGTGGFVVSGTNLDPSGGYNLVPLQSSGKLLTGWNYSAGRGEIDLVSNRAGGDIGGFRFYDYTNAGVMNNLMTIQGAGNVGIGTTTPVAKLHVYGNGTYSALFMNGKVGIGTTNPLSTLDIPNSASDLYAYNAAIGSLGIPSQNSVVMADPEGNLSATSSTSFFVSNNILSLWSGTKNGNIWNGDAGTGNVGIGTTTPGAKLEVFSSVSPNIYITTSDISKRPALWLNDGTNYAGMGFVLGDLRFSTTGSFDMPAMVIASSTGSVGIGTTTPAAKLNVAGTGNTSPMVLISGNSSTYGVLEVASDNVIQVLSNANRTEGLTYQFSSSGSPHFMMFSDYYTGGTEPYLTFGTYSNKANQLVLSTNGNVGIGTTAPAYKTEISGTFKVSTSSSSIMLDASGNVLVGI